MVDGYTFYRGGGLREFFIASVKAGLVCLFIAGCIDIPTAEVPGVETGNLLPNAVILSPPMTVNLDSTETLSNTIFLEGSEIIFEGIGFDPEDDTLDAASLHWNSDTEGELGTGSIFTKSDLPLGMHWIFLTATDSEGATARDSVRITIGEATNELPVAPSDLLAMASSATSVLLSWQDNSYNEAHFVVEQRIGGVDTDFTLSTTAEKNTTSIEITGLEAGTLYEFRVYAENTTGASGPSNIAEVTTPLEEIIEETLELLAPSNLKAVVQSATRVLLEWQDNSDNETHFIVEQRISGLDADFLTSTMVGENITSAEVTGLEANTLYEFRVYAYEESSSSASDYSNIEEATTLLAELTSYVTADNTLDSGQIDLVDGEGLIKVGYILLEEVEYRSALQFADPELREQMSGRSVDIATLRLYPDATLDTEMTYAVNAFSGSWDPSTINWSNQPAYYGTLQSEQKAKLLDSEPLEFDITAIVQEWASGKWDNNGLIVRSISDLISLVADFESLETESTDRQPQIYIKFKD